MKTQITANFPKDLWRDKSSLKIFQLDMLDTYFFQKVFDWILLSRPFNSLSSSIIMSLKSEWNRFKY